MLGFDIFSWLGRTFTFEVVMKKIACLSALTCVLAVAAGSATAGESTVSAGYAQGDL